MSNCTWAYRTAVIPVVHSPEPADGPGAFCTRGQRPGERRERLWAHGDNRLGPLLAPDDPRWMGLNWGASRYAIDVCTPMVYSLPMVFIETPVFTGQVIELLTDEEYGRFQQCLAAHPQMGDVIPGTGGLRKVRWSVQGRGKRGGVRVIYYHVSAAAQCRMLLIYRKGLKDDLTAAEKKVLRKLNADW